MTGTITARPGKGRAVLHIFAFLLVITLNLLAVVLPLNGKTTGQISDQYPNLFTPVGLTFSIWGIIYFFLFGFSIYQAFVLFKPNHPSRDKILSISWPFIINCLANAGWILAWHYEQIVLSAGIMLVLLISLIIIHEKLHLALPVKPIIEKLWLDIPFSLYLGWICIANIANIAVLLVYLDWHGAGMSPLVWTIIMMILGTLLNMFMVLFKSNIPFGLVGIWAFSGISLKKHSAEDEINQVIFCAQICISLIVLCIILELLKYWKKSVETGMNSQEEVVNL